MFSGSDRMPHQAELFTTPIAVSPDLTRVASDCAESPDRELDPMKSSAIDDQTNSSDAAVCRSEPRLGVSKGQGQVNAKSG